MSNPGLQESENQGVSSFEDFHVLKTGSGKDFDEIAVLAAQLCNAAVAAIIVVENGFAWIKSSYGTEEESMLLNPCFWKPALEQNKVVCIEDLYENSDFRSIKSNYTFYAGVPLITGEGTKLGVLYVADPKPGDLDKNQKSALQIVSRQILTLVDYQKQNHKLERVQKKLEERYRELEKFSSVVSHDIKSPLANIISLTELLREENKENFNDDTRQYLDFLAQSSYSLRSYVDGILTFYRSEKILEKEEEDVDLPNLLKNIADLYQVNPNVEITYPSSGRLKKVNKAALTQIFMNLISNAIKYNSKPTCKVDITYRESEMFYEFEVSDNGNGIPAEDFDKIFDLFTTLNQNDRDGNPGSGIGLATVKKLLEHLGGSIAVESELHKGSNFKFKIKRL